MRRSAERSEREARDVAATAVRASDSRTASATRGSTSRSGEAGRRSAGAALSAKRREPRRGSRLASEAERVGFEPTVRTSPTLVFETSPFNRSGTSPAKGRGVSASPPDGSSNVSGSRGHRTLVREFPEPDMATAVERPTVRRLAVTQEGSGRTNPTLRSGIHPPRPSPSRTITQPGRRSTARNSTPAESGCSTARSKPSPLPLRTTTPSLSTTPRASSCR